MKLIEMQIKPREIVNRKSLINVLQELLRVAVDQPMRLASPEALANEIGIEFDLMDVAKIFKETPILLILNLEENIWLKIFMR